jgi:hypothetical protein
VSAVMHSLIPFYKFVSNSPEAWSRDVRAVMSDDIDDHEFMKLHFYEAFICHDLWTARGLVPLQGKRRVEFYADSDEIQQHAQGVESDSRRAIICGMLIDHMRHLGLSLRQAYLAHDIGEYRLVFQED